MITNILANNYATIVMYYMLEAPNLKFSYSSLKEKTKFSNNVLYSAINTLKSYNVVEENKRKYYLNSQNDEVHKLINILREDKSKFGFVSTMGYINIKTIVKFLENKKILKAYLFGSYARGSQRVDSDIDIAVLTDSDLDIEQWELDLKRKGINVEFHKFKELNKLNPLHKEILEEGKLLMKKSS